MLDWLIISILCTYGLSVILVEKRFDYPVRYISICIRWLFLRKIDRKFQKMLLCTVCSSFWIALPVDLFLFLFTGFSYFLWPFSGFAASGITWTIYEWFHVLDKNEDEHGLG